MHVLYARFTCCTLLVFFFFYWLRYKPKWRETSLHKRKFDIKYKNNHWRESVLGKSRRLTICIQMEISIYGIKVNITRLHIAHAWGGNFLSNRLLYSTKEQVRKIFLKDEFSHWFHNFFVKLKSFDTLLMSIQRSAHTYVWKSKRGIHYQVCSLLNFLLIFSPFFYHTRRSG